ncbi:hypothetical protein NDU88_006459 [Pleurodeles waltl]|uniref:Secreted protein n=1 Tax=Pleurodeles waltl TaxID=8319 RepID=A0AAV7ULP0_PLEWA|nr:hypothetical protein NDU88_006459 [Pleurodeles waltl]
MPVRGSCVSRNVGKALLLHLPLGLTTSCGTADCLLRFWGRGADTGCALVYGCTYIPCHAGGASQHETA